MLVRQGAVAIINDRTTKQDPEQKPMAQVCPWVQLKSGKNSIIIIIIIIIIITSH